MKVCLSSRQAKEYLQKADEIKVDYRDKGSIFDLIEDYPDKTIILDCLNADIDWKLLERYKTICRNNFIICVGSVNELRQAHTLKIRRYLGYPIVSFWELDAIKQFDVDYIKLDMELFFQMDRVKKIGIPVRAIPNIAYNDNLSHINGINGQWIRPEDLESIYGNYIAAIEFDDCDREKEQALYRIYIQNKEWRQPLNLIITNLDADGVNRMIPRDVSEARLNCAQKCIKGGACRLCFRAFNLADPEKFKTYADNIKNN